MTALAPFAPTPAEMYIEASRQRYGVLTDDFLKIYPVQTDDDVRAAYFASIRDLLIGWGVRSWARAAIATGKSKVYSYYLAQTSTASSSVHSTARRSTMCSASCRCRTSRDGRASGSAFIPARLESAPEQDRTASA